MDRTPIQISELVALHHATALDIQRASYFSATTQLLIPAQTDRYPIIAGAAIEDVNIEVKTHFSIRLCGMLGTFNSPKMLMACVWVNGVDDYSRNITVPTREAEGWARARLGTSWADFGYHVQTLREQIQRWPQLYVAFVDPTGEPVLAPSDFQWNDAGVGAPARPRKMMPDPTNKELSRRLKKFGDTETFAPVDDGLQY